MNNPLQQLLADAQAHIPFYREYWGDHGIDARRLQEPEILARLPVLTKDELKQRGSDRLVDPRYPRESLASLTTSGSTGQPLRVWRDKATLRRRQLRTFAGLRFAGHRPWHRFVWLELMHPDYPKKVTLIHRLLRIRYMDLGMPPAQLLADYASSGADLVYGQFSALLLIAQGLAARPDLPRPRPRVVVGYGEQISMRTREQIESGLGAPISEFYGNTEVGLIACRRPGDAAYRTLGDDLLLEFLPASETPGYERLIVTMLRGGPMTFIRYDTGDLVRRDHSLAGSPIVEIAGRQLDFLSFPDGSKVAPFQIDFVMDEIAGVRQYRLVQQADMSIDLHVEVDPADREGTVTRARKLAGDIWKGQVELRVHAYDELPQGTGKLRFIQSLVR